MNSPYGPPPEFDVPVAEVEPVAARPQSRWKVWVAMAAVFALATAVTGVALSRSGGNSAIATLQSAPGNTRSAGTAQFTSTVSLSAEGETHDIVRMRGGNDFRDRRATLRLSGPGYKEEIRLLDGIEYVSQNMVSLPGGAQWVSIDPEKDLGINPTGKFGSGDPSAGLDFLTVVHDPRATGTDTVNGTTATHYEFTLDLSDTTKLIHDAEDKLGATQLVDGLKALEKLTDLQHIPAEAWLDRDGRVIRLTYSLVLGENGTRITETSQTDYSHFGEPVTVTVPAQVVPFSDVPDLFSRIAARAQKLAES